MIRRPYPLLEIRQPVYKIFLNLLIAAASGLILYYFISMHQSSARVFLAAVVTIVSGVNFFVLALYPYVEVYEDHFSVHVTFIQRKQVFYYDVNRMESQGSVLSFYERNADRTVVKTSGWSASSKKSFLDYVSERITRRTSENKAG